MNNFLVFQYDLENFDVESISRIYEDLSKKIPNNINCIAIPNTCSLNCLDKEELIQIRDLIDKIIQGSF